MSQNRDMGHPTFSRFGFVPANAVHITNCVACEINNGLEDLVEQGGVDGVKLRHDC